METNVSDAFKASDTLTVDKLLKYSFTLIVVAN